MQQMLRLVWEVTEYIRVLSIPNLCPLSYFASAKSNNIGFLETMSSLNQTRCFMVSTRYPKAVSPLSHNTQKLRVSTRYTTEKNHGLHDIRTEQNRTELN